VDLLNAEAKYALDFTMAQRAEEQAQHGQDIAQLSHRLNLLASFAYHGVGRPIRYEFSADIGQV